jgi:autotransporter-associated beta strand protein
MMVGLTLGIVAIFPAHTQAALYAEDINFLYTINKTTGQTTRVAQLAPYAPALTMAFDPVTGVLYAQDLNFLYTINKTTGQTTRVAQLAPYAPALTMAFELTPPPPLVASWTGGGSNDNWTATANWGGVLPAEGYNLKFGALTPGAHTATNNDFSTGTQFASVTFLANAPAYDLKGKSIRLAGAVTNQSANDQKISLGMEVVAGGGTLQDGGKKMTLAGGISGGALSKAGSGTVVLAANNTYSGPTTITAGTLEVGNGGTIGTLGTGTVTDNAALVFNRSDTLLVPNAISGTGTLTQAGTGTLVLSGTNSYSGGTFVTSGTLEIAGADALPSGRNLTIAARGRVVLRGGLNTASAPIVAVPEPSSLALLGAVVLGVAAYAWSASRSSAPGVRRIP